MDARSSDVSGGTHELFRLHLSESRTSLMNEILHCAFVMAVSRALAEAKTSTLS